jgi:hypothetical protein
MTTGSRTLSALLLLACAAPAAASTAGPVTEVADARAKKLPETLGLRRRVNLGSSAARIEAVHAAWHDKINRKAILESRGIHGAQEVVGYSHRMNPGDAPTVAQGLKLYLESLSRFVELLKASASISPAELNTTPNGQPAFASDALILEKARGELAAHLSGKSSAELFSNDAELEFLHQNQNDAMRLVGKYAHWGSSKKIAEDASYLRADQILRSLPAQVR